jgi:hypothetical protein
MHSLFDIKIFAFCPHNVFMSQAHIRLSSSKKIYLCIPYISHNKQWYFCMRHEQIGLANGNTCVVCEAATEHLYMTPINFNIQSTRIPTHTRTHRLIHACTNAESCHSWNASSHLARQEIPRVGWNTKSWSWSEEPATESCHELASTFPMYLLEIRFNGYPPIYVYVLQVASYRHVYGP